MRDSRRMRLILGVLLVAAIALITTDFRSGGGSPLRGVGARVFGPVERAANAVTGPVSSFLGGAGNGSKVAALQAANAQLRAELSAAQLSRSDEKQLQALLDLAGTGGYRIVPASVIAKGQDYADTVTLDAGSTSGIKPDETVLNGAGFVGTVTEVSPDTCTVQLATDASAVVGARMAGTNQIGSVTGTGKTFPGGDVLKLTLYAANAVLRPGDQLVTLASVHNTPYVAGVPIGTVTTVQGGAAGSLTKNALVRPFVDFSSLGVVGVVVGAPHRNPGDSVLPPSPKPTPTVTVTVGATPRSKSSKRTHP